MMLDKEKKRRDKGYYEEYQVLNMLDAVSKRKVCRVSHDECRWLALSIAKDEFTWMDVRSRASYWLFEKHSMMETRWKRCDLDFSYLLLRYDNEIRREEEKEIT